MAENLWNRHTEDDITDPRDKELMKVCKRQEESRAYTSAGLYIWPKCSKLLRRIFLVAPIFLLGLITTKLLK